MSPDTAAGIVATVLHAATATAYAPTDPNYGIVVIPDGTWIGAAYVEYVRIDGLTTHGYATSVELHTTGGNATSEWADIPGDTLAPIAIRIRDAINAVVTA